MIIQEDFESISGDTKVWRTTGIYDSNGMATITDCPFSPDVVIAYYIQDANNACTDVGGNSLPRYSSGISSGTLYIFNNNNFGVSVSGKVISIKSGFAIARNKQFELVAIKN